MPRLRPRIGRQVDALEKRPRFGVPQAIFILPEITATADRLGRDASSIATGSGRVALDELPAWFSEPVSSLYPAVRSSLTEDVDGRLFSPARGLMRANRRRWRPRIISPASKWRYGPRGARQGVYTAAGQTYQHASNVAVCIRRKRRRQVLMATGKGGGRHRRPLRGPNSQIWC